MLVAVGEAAHDDARQAVLAFQAHHVLAIEDGVEHQAARAVRNELLPIRHAGGGDRRLDDAEVLGAVRVGGDDQLVAVMLDRILVADLARLDDARLGERRVGVDEARLARLMVVRIDDHELGRLRGRDRHVEADVLLGIDENIVLDRRADDVPVDEQRAVVVVEAHVEDRLAVVGPHDAAARVGDAVGQVLSGRQVAEADGVKLRPLVVAGVGEEPVIGAVLEAAQVPVGLALGLAVAVEQDRFVPAGAGPAADQRILSAGDEAGVVGEGPIGGRDGAVVLLEAAAHLAEQVVLQPARLRQLRLAVGILGIEVGADLRVEHGRLAHHVLPVVGLEPRVVVDQFDVMPSGDVGPARGAGRLDESMTMAGAVHCSLHAETASDMRSRR